MDCGEIFKDELAEERPSEVEDGRSPWDGVAICPFCGSDYLEEVDVCPMCGGPVTGEGSFCEDCKDAIDYEFSELFDRLEWRYDIGREAIKKLAFDRAEERDFYA